MNYSLFSPDQARRTGRAVRAFESGQQSSAGRRWLLPVPQFAPIAIKNTTGATVSAGGVLGLNGAVSNPNIDVAHLAQFRSAVVFNGRAPVLPDDLSYFAIPLFDCAAGDTVPACAAGICEAMLYIPSGMEGTDFCSPTAGNTSQLQSNPHGAAEILWAANDVGETHVAGMQWAIIRLPTSGDSGAIRFRLTSDLAECGNASAVRIYFDASDNETIGPALTISDRGAVASSLLAALRAGVFTIPAGTCGNADYFSDSQTYEPFVFFPCCTFGSGGSESGSQEGSGSEEGSGSGSGSCLTPAMLGLPAPPDDGDYALVVSGGCIVYRALSTCTGSGSGSASTTT